MHETDRVARNLQKSKFYTKCENCNASQTVIYVENNIGGHPGEVGGFNFHGRFNSLPENIHREKSKRCYLIYRRYLNWNWQCPSATRVIENLAQNINVSRQFHLSIFTVHKKQFVKTDKI